MDAQIKFWKDQISAWRAEIKNSQDYIRRLRCQYMNLGWFPSRRFAFLHDTNGHANLIRERTKSISENRAKIYEYQEAVVMSERQLLGD